MMKARMWGKAALATASAMALTCALAPAAFAAIAGDTGVEGEQAFDTDKKATTEVAMGVSTDQIAASVPLNLKVQAKTNGGALAVPGTYAIKNKSPMVIHVASMKGAIEAASFSAWTLTDTDHATATPPADVAKNELTLKVNGTALDGNEQTLTGAAWNVSAATGANAATPGELKLALAGSTSQLNTSTAVAKLLTIEYTIAAGENA